MVDREEHLSNDSVKDEFLNEENEDLKKEEADKTKKEIKDLQIEETAAKIKKLVEKEKFSKTDIERRRLKRKIENEKSHLVLLLMPYIKTITDAMKEEKIKKNSVKVDNFIDALDTYCYDNKVDKNTGEPLKFLQLYYGKLRFLESNIYKNKENELKLENNKLKKIQVKKFFKNLKEKGICDYSGNIMKKEEVLTFMKRENFAEEIIEEYKKIYENNYKCSIQVGTEKGNDFYLGDVAAINKYRNKDNVLYAFYYALDRFKESVKLTKSLEEINDIDISLEMIKKREEYDIYIEEKYLNRDFCNWYSENKELFANWPMKNYEFAEALSKYLNKKPDTIRKNYTKVKNIRQKFYLKLFSK